MPLRIYVNYIKQHRVKYEYADTKDKDKAEISLTTETETLEENSYYDYGTEFNMLVEALQTDHYMVTTKINGEEVLEEDMEDILKTRNGNISKYTLGLELTEDYTVYVDVVTEKYTNLLKEIYYGGENTYNLNEKTEVFGEVGTIRYTVSGTYEYGTEVELKIYVERAKDEGSKYYVLKGVEITDGEGNEVEYSGEETEDAECTVYTLKYKVEGAGLEEGLKICLDYTPGYWVRF